MISNEKDNNRENNFRPGTAVS